MTKFILCQVNFKSKHRLHISLELSNELIPSLILAFPIYSLTQNSVFSTKFILTYFLQFSTSFDPSLPFIQSSFYPKHVHLLNYELLGNLLQTKFQSISLISKFSFLHIENNQHGCNKKRAAKVVRVQFNWYS